MTRGNIIAIINDRKIVSTEQFNGDMYIKEWHGEKIIQRMYEWFDNIKEFEEFCAAFNEENFGYEDLKMNQRDIVKEKKVKSTEIMDEIVTEDLLNFNRLFANNIYYQKRSSDYLYIINLRDYQYPIIDKSWELHRLGNNDRIVIAFWEVKAKKL